MLSLPPLTTLILYPYADATVFGHYAFRVIGSSAILISVYAANFRRSLLIFVLVLAVPALMQRFLLPRAHVSSFSIANMALSFIFDVVVVVMILRHVFARKAVRLGDGLRRAVDLSVGGVQFCERVPHGVGYTAERVFISTCTPTFTTFPTPRLYLFTSMLWDHDFARGCWNYTGARQMPGRFQSWR